MPSSSSSIISSLSEALISSLIRTSIGAWLISMTWFCSLLSSTHSASLSSSIPSPATDEMKTTGSSSFSSFLDAFFFLSSFSSRASILVMAKMRALVSNSGLYCSNSLSRILYSLTISLLVTGTMNSSTALRSICRKNRKPRPRPSLAPSMIPGISAMQNDRPSRYETMPSCGVRVVNG